MLNALLLLPLAEDDIDPAGIKAGPIGFAFFIGLIIAVALLGWSLSKHLRKAQAAKDAGVYGDEPVHTEAAEPTDAAPDARPEPGTDSGQEPRPPA